MKNLKENIFEKFHLDKTSSILLLFAFIQSLMMALAYPAIRKVTGELLPSQYFAIEAFLQCLVGLFVCFLWNFKKFRLNSFKLFKILAWLEIIVCAVIGIYCYFNFNIWVFAIGSLLVSCIITIYLARIINSFRVATFPDRQREFYDNNMNIITSISALIGLGIGIFFPIPLSTSILLWGFGCFATIGWLVIYKRNKQILSNIDKN